MVYSDALEFIRFSSNFLHIDILLKLVETDSHNILEHLIIYIFSLFLILFNT